MKSSLFRKYFSVCSMCVLACIIVLGGILMLFASQYFMRDKFALMNRTVTQAADITAWTYTRVTDQTGRFNKNIIVQFYTALSVASDTDLLLADTSGNVIFAMENREEATESRKDVQLDSQAVKAALKGKYQQRSTLGTYYGSMHYVVGVPVTVDDVNVGVLFATTSTRSLMQFLSNLMEMFLLSSVFVLLIAFVVIYFITVRLVTPLKQMAEATNSFSKGDFSVRVPVSGYNEIGQLAMAFNNMASSLAITEGSRRSFIANVSHELKTPMTTIGGFIDGILDGTIPEEKRDQYLQVVGVEVKRLSRLVRSMLDTSRIEAGEVNLNLSLFDISELIRQTIFTFEQLIEEKNLQIEGLDTDKVMIYADRDLMHQVIYNLIENAVKFVNRDGVISFKYRNDGKNAYVAIRNTGEGLEKTEVPKLFERFYKSDRSRSLNKNGVGLGLHIVRSIINFHSGEVVVRSTEGEYTEFEFSIPNP